jgi:two-component system alkaline phosphatase synthesis response regulator PhoP
LLVTTDTALYDSLMEQLGGEFELLEVAPGLRLPSAAAVLVDMRELEYRHIAGLQLPRDMALIALVPAEKLGTFQGFEGLDDWADVATGGTELRARIMNALRRRGLLEQRERAIQVDELIVDPDRYEVRVGGAAVELTFKEFELLRFLASNPGRVFSREVLLDRVWGFDYYGGTRTVDVHIRRIRSKIETGTRVYIKTIRGAGYLFE